MSNLLLTLIGNSIFKFKDMDYDKINMESDNDIISKLKFIGKIQKGEKINVKNMYVQPDGIATKISRSFINIDTRANTFNFLNTVVKRSFDLISLHSGSNSSFDKNLCINLIKDLRESKTGIENLKETYNSDVMFGCKLETLIQDIEGRLTELDKVYDSNIKDKEVILTKEEIEDKNFDKKIDEINSKKKNKI